MQAFSCLVEFLEGVTVCAIGDDWIGRQGYVIESPSQESRYSS